MARDHAQIRLDMWGDDDWRKLSVPAQHLYMLLLTSPSLSFCGVADWRPARIAKLAAGWTTADVLAAAEDLTGRLFLLIDDATEEALIRSFVRHDGLMKMPNMATAMATAHAAIASPYLRGVVVHELRRLHEKQPELAGWKSKRALAVLERDSIDPSVKGSVNPSGNPSVKGSSSPEPNPSGNPSVNPSPTPAPTPTPAPSSSKEEEEQLELLSDKSDAPDRFDEFWTHYPRKEAKIDARKAWAKITKKTDPQTVIDGVTDYKFNPDRQFIPLAGSWLRGQRWEDEPSNVRHLPRPAPGYTGPVKWDESRAPWNL